MRKILFLTTAVTLLAGGAHAATAPPELQTTCLKCHSDKSSSVSCTNSKWTGHNGSKVTTALYDAVTLYKTGKTCSGATTTPPPTTTTSNVSVAALTIELSERTQAGGRLPAECAVPAPQAERRSPCAGSFTAPGSESLRSRLPQSAIPGSTPIAW